MQPIQLRVYFSLDTHTFLAHFPLDPFTFYTEKNSESLNSHCFLLICNLFTFNEDTTFFKDNR